MSKVLTCEHLSKTYGKEKTALDNIDLSLDFGRIVGLLGPNGSGKTTPARRRRRSSPTCRMPTGCPIGCGWRSW